MKNAAQNLRVAMEQSNKGEEVTESIAQRAKLELEEKKVELKVVN